MKNTLLKSRTALIIGFMALIFTACKDQRKENDQLNYPPADGTETLTTDDIYDDNDTLYESNGTDDMIDNGSTDQDGRESTGGHTDENNTTIPPTSN